MQFDINYLLEYFMRKKGEFKVSDGTQLFTTGLLGSLSFISIISIVEKHYGISVPTKFYKYEHFDSIKKIKNTPFGIIKH